MNAEVYLTKRQDQVAELIAWGATAKDVANRFHRKPKTIENTVRAIYEKTGVTKVNELSAWYFCTHFNISFKLSPLQRGVIAGVLLLIWVPFEITTHSDAVRTRTVKRTKTERTGQRAGRKDDYLVIEL